MNIGIDISPTTNSRSSQNKVRGAGKYIEILRENIQKYDSKNSYTFFDKTESIPSKLDIIHYPYFDPFFQTLPLRNKKKTVVTVHDLIPLLFQNNFPAGIKGKLKWNLQKMLLTHVDAIITDSESSKRDIEKITGISSKRIFKVYLGVSEKFSKQQISTKRRDEIRRKYGLPDFFVLYVGDATWNKNLPRLIEAVKSIDVTLAVVGKTLSLNPDEINHNPWNKDLFRVTSEMKNNKQFLPLGFVPEADLIELYNIANLLVLPSLYEGFGLPVLEAMSSGCPVVTSKEGSLSEVGGDAVYYIDPYDTKSIANGISEVFNSSSLRSKLSQKGLSQAKNFSIKKMMEDTSSVYINS